jgi:cysteine desulfurase
VEGASAAGAPVKALCLSAIEHDSVLRTAAVIAERDSGIRLASMPVTKDGVIDVETLERILKEVGSPALVAVMAANNETGVIQPVADVIAKVNAAGGFCLVDAVQACGRIAADLAGAGADYLTLSAHKLGGPQGTGALVVKESAPLSPQLVGGSQEKNRRAGTENVAGIAGLGAAVKACRHDDTGAHLRDAFELGLRQRLPDVIIFGESVPRLANTSNFAIPGISAETAIIALDLDGVMVSSGAACSSGKVKPSHVLQAMGVSAELARSALRVSLGWNSTQTDVEAALASLEKLSARIRARRAA